MIGDQVTKGVCMKLDGEVDPSATTASRNGGPALGQRLRQIRSARGLSVRELARRAGCSASLVSQVELGRIVPSASIVYALANELDVSLDALFGSGEPPTATKGPASCHPHAEADAAHAPGGGWGRALGPDGEGILLRATDRKSINLSTGVRWERLTPQHDSRVDFLDVVYAPHGKSSESDQAVRHDGREYLRVLHGELEAIIGFETLRLAEGDSLAFDPSTPHRYRNPTDQIVRCLSVIVHDLT
jgi:transcriptional regulator with XRE-family HTH domain